MSVAFLQRKPDSGLGNIRSSPGSPSRNIDWVLMTVQWALAIIGCFIVYSASFTKTPADPYLFATRQLVFLIVAAIAMVAVMSFDYDWIRERAYFFYGCTLIVLVLVMLFGAVRNGARLSFDLGPISIQPAEIAKVTVLMALAAYLGDDKTDEVSYPRFVSGLLLVGAPAVLVILQPDLGSASVLVVMVMAVLLVAGAKARYIALITVLAVVTVVAAVAAGVLDDYQWNRIRAVFNQNSSDPKFQDFVYQQRNAMRALATGGVRGKGWLEGPMTLARSDIPVQWADFPMSAVGEQFGLIGCGVVLGLFAIALVRIWRIAHLSRDTFGTYICAGVFAMILWQVFQNLGMTVGIMPVTGLPMPFISYGGSGLIAFFLMFGLVQSVHMRRMR